MSYLRVSVAFRMKSLVLVVALQATLLILGVSIVIGDEDSSGGLGDYADFKDASPAESIRIMRKTPPFLLSYLCPSRSSSQTRIQRQGG